MAYVSNNRHCVKTEAAEFMLEQRNVGFADNDGQWIVSQLPELFWNGIGVLTQRRPGAFLGVFADKAAADKAVADATAQSINIQAVHSMGRVSC